MAGQTNTYVPAGLTYRNSYNWGSHPGYSERDVSDSTTTRARSAYEWFQWGSRPAEPGRSWMSNPPFHSKAAGELLNTLVNSSDQRPSRVLRGFIRRSEYNVADSASMSRLYFMYNPEQITREYVNYLDQGALDPFNTVFQSGNLVAPPSFMNFTFELFFDRQDEAAFPNNPGVFVDYEYFDLVVRNVIPGTAGNNSLPDNGVMMVNPRDITVVFSPEITVQGRPLNAQVNFEKFTHRMTPTRMRISLTMRVVYFGPLREMTTFTQDEMRASATIPWGDTEPERYNFTYLDLVTTGIEGSMSSTTTTTTATDGTPADTSNLSEQVRQLHGASIQVNANVVNKVMALVAANGTTYDLNGRANLWKEADCSSLVWGGFHELGYHTALGMNASYPDATAGIWGHFVEPSTKGARLWGFPGGQLSGQFENMAKMVKGDLLLRVNHPNKPKNHIAFVVSASSSGVTAFHAKSEPGGVGETTYTSSSDINYNYGIRPLPVGTGAVGSQSNSVHAGNVTGVPD